MAGLRWGAFVPQGWRMDLADVEGSAEKFETMVRCAREAEAYGFDSIWLYDHFHSVPRTLQEPVFECWTATAALARETTRVQLGQMVTCNGYRPPSLLAKMSSCIDVMSHGRLILGIGAGWHGEEFRAYGYDYPDTPERLRQLGESVQIIRAMWDEERPTFEGRHYEIHEPVNQPKPLSRTPLWIGGGGERVTLKLVARFADGCNVGGGDPEVAAHKLDVLRNHCRSVGRDFDEIARSSHIEDVVLGDEAEVERIERDVARRRGLEVDRDRGRYHGSPAEVAARIQELVNAGIDYVLVFVGNVHEQGALARFAEEVMPRVHPA